MEVLTRSIHSASSRMRLVEVALAQYLRDSVHGNSYWADVVRIPGAYAQDLGAVALPGRADARPGPEHARAAAGPTLAHLAVGDPGCEPAGKPGQVHQSDLGGSRARRVFEIPDAGAAHDGSGPNRHIRRRADPPGRLSPRWRRQLLLVAGNGSSGLPSVPLPCQTLHVHLLGHCRPGRPGLGPTCARAVAAELQSWSLFSCSQPWRYSPESSSSDKRSSRCFEQARGPVFGPFDAARGYEAILRRVWRIAAIVLAAGLVLTFLVRRRPNAGRHHGSDRDDGGSGRRESTIRFHGAPVDVRDQARGREDHRGRRARPARAWSLPRPSHAGSGIRWVGTWPARAIGFASCVAWERDTLQPKSGINFGIEYTHTLGTAELYDYEWYFSGFLRTVHDKDVAESLGVELGKKVVYYPRRGFDMWNTRYFVVPAYPNGWRDENRGFASFLFKTQPVYPERDRFLGPNGKEEYKEWVETKDFRIQRNDQEFPRAWVVHQARTVRPVQGLSRDTRTDAMQEILYAQDKFWNDSTKVAFDPHRMAWLANDLNEDGPQLSGQPPGPAETVKVTYPSPQRAILEVTLDSPGLVILSDIHYPGWILDRQRQARADLPGERDHAGSGRLCRPSSAGLHLCAPVVSCRASHLDPGDGRIGAARPDLGCADPSINYSERPYGLDSPEAPVQLAPA